MDALDNVCQPVSVKTPPKRSFRAVCEAWDITITEELLSVFASLAELDINILTQMFRGEPVGRREAKRVFQEVKDLLQWWVSFESVDIPLLPPTFLELHEEYHFDLNALADKSGISLNIIGRMLRDEIVGRSTAQRVLFWTGSLTGQAHTLDNTRILTSTFEFIP